MIVHFCDFRLLIFFRVSSAVSLQKGFFAKRPTAAFLIAFEFTRLFMHCELVPIQTGLFSEAFLAQYANVTSMALNLFVINC